jgi:hypothetical protein
MEQEVWKIGKNSSCVVSNVAPKRYSYTTHDYETEKEYYGGYIIAESIPYEKMAKVIAAAPEMLEALVKIREWLDDDTSLPSDETMALVREAIKKATE